MRKIVSILIIAFLSVSLCSCGNMKTDELTVATSPDETIISESEKSVTSVFATETNSLATASLSDNNNIETSDEFIILNELGIYALVEEDIDWRHYLVGNYSFELNYKPKTFKSDDGTTYIELAITNHNDIEKIQSNFDVDLKRSQDESYYECPFFSISDLKEHMQKTYTEKQVEYMLSYMSVVEHNGSLYISDNGGVYSDRVPLEIKINQKSDYEINFSISFDLFIDDLYFETTYHTIYDNGRWLIDSMENYSN